jgi:predicted amidohydrolase YtcJ
MIRDMNRAGLTTFGVAGAIPVLVAMYRKWRSENRLNVRSSASTDRAPAPLSRWIARSPHRRDEAVPGATMYVDQVLYGESVYAPLHDPMFDSTSNPRPNSSLSGAGWRWRLRRPASRSCARGADHTIDAFLDQIEGGQRGLPIKNLRWMLAHFNQSNAAQLARNAEAAACTPPVHRGTSSTAASCTRSSATTRTSSRRSRRFRTAASCGVRNATAAPPTIHAVHHAGLAVTGKMTSGLKVMRQTISREDALIAHTRRNAFLVFQENNLGAIQPGKLADLVVLDRDYLTIPRIKSRTSNRVLTMVGGRIVLRRQCRDRDEICNGQSRGRVFRPVRRGGG